MLHISLIGSSGVSVADGFTNGQCEVEFSNVPAGNYRVSVLGQNVESSSATSLMVDSHGSQAFEVKVDPHPSDGSSVTSLQPAIGAQELAIPDKARKEFDKAGQEIAKQDWKKAMDRLEKAIAIYPNYAEAYNNIGAVYAHLGDRAQERQALQKAVALNDHFAAAQVNLARLDIVDRNYPSAEALLNKASATNPSDVKTLVLLANTQLLDLHYDEALTTCRKVHAMTNEPHAAVHYVAARTLEAQHKPTEALAELQVFLTEEQAGPRADAARREIAALQKLVQ